jgi:hypothetical protein
LPSIKNIPPLPLKNYPATLTGIITMTPFIDRLLYEARAYIIEIEEG